MHTWVLTPSAHPRSRGENFAGLKGKVSSAGSSPLTRGKHIQESRRLAPPRLIPAHAGKTRGTTVRDRISSAHPRSRGENLGFRGGLESLGGSSPLTRGKRATVYRRVAGPRLIPAHAGKTSAPKMRRDIDTAHPRSRGENAGSEDESAAFCGSSPLTRGKPYYKTMTRCWVRLIPAHAGKTRRGWPPQASAPGSSPLTRGKHVQCTRPGGARGLIPAHAGKTGRCARSPVDAAAHPRSRGENDCTAPNADLIPGSSPLTRGKRPTARRRHEPGRLIPAHAGKTLPDMRFYCADRSDLGNP